MVPKDRRALEPRLEPRQISGAPPSRCLPCRRSWVRVPSAASKRPANRRFLQVIAPRGRPSVRHRTDTQRELIGRRQARRLETPLGDWATALIRTLDLLSKAQTLKPLLVTSGRLRHSEWTKRRGPDTSVSGQSGLASKSPGVASAPGGSVGAEPLPDRGRRNRPGGGQRVLTKATTVSAPAAAIAPATSSIASTPSTYAPANGFP